MRKIINSVMLLCLILICVTLVGAKRLDLQADTIQGQIIVQGKATSKVTPDIAKVMFSVETINENINEATTNNNNIVKEISNYLNSIDIKQEDIVTKNYYVYPKYNYLDREEKFIGFVVDNSIEFKTNKLENLADIISKITSLGANKLNGVNFSYNDTQSLYNNALKMALENAKQKAQMLTDKTIVVSKIVEKNVNVCDAFTDTALLLARASNKTVFEGMVVVEANIEVSFIEE